MKNPTRTTVSGNPTMAATRDLNADYRRMANAPGAKCGNCGKPFNAIRKPAALLAVENEAPGVGVVVSEYLVCRVCNRRIRAEGDKAIIDPLADAHTAAHLALSAPGGRA